VSAAGVPLRAWYAVAPATAVTSRRPHSARLLDVPLVLWRGADGRPAAFVDRCPHRGVPLSAGRLVDARLECAYHGWRFEADGRCALVPALPGPPDARRRAAETWPVAEAAGQVWACPSPDPPPPPADPMLLPPGASRVELVRVVPASFADAIENVLDVPHTAFVHAGLFRRAAARRPVEVEIRETAEGAEAEYLDEPRPSGLAGRLLAPGATRVRHVDRFRLPALAQVEYRFGDRWLLVVDHFLAPVAPRLTRVAYRVTFRLPLPAVVLRPLLRALATRVLAQDVRVLGLQARGREAFGDEGDVSTLADVLGPRLRRQLARAAAGEPAEGRPPTRVTLQI